MASTTALGHTALRRAHEESGDPPSAGMVCHGEHAHLQRVPPIFVIVLGSAAGDVLGMFGG